MLKKVVLPAPLGPMIDTIERSGTLKVTSLTAVRPPNCLVTFCASSASGPSRPPGSSVVSVAAMSHRHRDDGLLALGFVELGLAPALRDQALWPHDHHDHQQEPVDRERDLRDVEVDLHVEQVADVRRD